jgi:hypothetical protein
MLPVDLPTFSATWWPLQMETIPGSGELITVAVVAQASSGQAKVRQSIAPVLLSTLFGQTSGKGMQMMVGTTVLSIQKQLDEGVSVKDLELPFGGFAFAHGRDGVARDFSEIFDIAVRLSAAFGFSAFGARKEVPDASKRAFEDWADKVRMDLLARELPQPIIPDEFNVRIKLARKHVKFGFLRSGYAVNFGVLRPGQTSGDSRSLKVKVFDLEALRRDQILPIDNAEVMLGCPPETALATFSNRELETFHASLAFLDDEAKARKVRLVRCSSPGEAAQHIRDRLAA